jgi:hypothetical protein
VGQEFISKFYDILKQANKKHPVFVVSHFKPDFLETTGLPHKDIGIYGLEFRCYDWYIRNEWDGESDVLFMHDDERIAGPWVFDQIAKLKHDQAYIFEDFAECKANGGKHGRGIYCSKAFIDFILGFECKCMEAQDHYDNHNPGILLPGVGPHTGFWYDPWNRGDHYEGKPPPGVRHYNSSIWHFAGIVGRAKGEKLDVGNKIFIPGFESGRRGTFGAYERARKILSQKKENPK